MSLYFAGTVEAVSLQDATAEVAAGMNDLQDQLPLAVVDDSSEQARTEPCPDGSSGQLTNIDRTIYTAASFDVPGWLRQLSAKYNEMEGWSARLRTVGSSDHIVLTLVDRKLMLFTVATGTDEGPAGLTIKATSRCSTI